MTLDQIQEEEFKSFAQEMLACFHEGFHDCNQNFDCPYKYGEMRYGAWCAGYAKALEDSFRIQGGSVECQWEQDARSIVHQKRVSK